MRWCMPLRAFIGSAVNDLRANFLAIVAAVGIDLSVFHLCHSSGLGLGPGAHAQLRGECCDNLFFESAARIRSRCSQSTGARVRAALAVRSGRNLGAVFARWSFVVAGEELGLGGRL